MTVYISYLPIESHRHAVDSVAVGAGLTCESATRAAGFRAYELAEVKTVTYRKAEAWAIAEAQRQTVRNLSKVAGLLKDGPLWKAAKDFAHEQLVVIDALGCDGNAAALAKQVRAAL